ncbi:MAG: universal stress protein [Halobacteriales archaeon]|nr:universal stress protein [Halobacteriales archaeon]
MFDSVVIATDGSRSVERAVSVALDLAERFDATVHALFVVDVGDVEAAPEPIRKQLREALEERGEDALDEVVERAAGEVIPVVREGRPPQVISEYAKAEDVDLVAMGTRGRHGENRFLIGSVAERVVRTCPVPVLTVRQLESAAAEPADDAAA